MRGVGVGVTQRCWLVLGYEEGSCACITSHCRGSECTKGCYTSRGVPPPQGFPFSRGISLLQRCPTSQSISLFQRCLTSTGISFLQRDFPHPEVSHFHQCLTSIGVSLFQRNFPLPGGFCAWLSSCCHHTGAGCTHGIKLRPLLGGETAQEKLCLSHWILSYQKHLFLLAIKLLNNAVFWLTYLIYSGFHFSSHF